jgi:hypothetical protein
MIEKQIVAYQKGSVDAFVAAFIYWKVFKSVRKQTYHSVDVFSDKFERELTGRTSAEFVVSIGANIRRVFHGTRLYAFENNRYDDKNISCEMHTYQVDPDVSLTWLMIQTLVKDGYLSTTDSTYLILKQFFQFNPSKTKFICEKADDYIKTVLPDLEVKDFETLSKKLYSPMSALIGNIKKTEYVRQMDMYHKKLAKARTNKIQIWRDMLIECGDPVKAPVLFFNTDLYQHPRACEDFQDEDHFVFVYQMSEDGARGKIIAPKNNRFLTTCRGLFHFTHKYHGSKSMGEVLLPHSVFSELLSY